MSIDNKLEIKLQQIHLVIFDVDGVLTDGGLLFGDDGQQYKRFHSRDGHGIRMLQDSGVETAIITGRTSKVVEHRAKELSINHVYQGHRQKRPAFEQLREKLGLDYNNIAFIGDDVIDLPVMSRVGIAMTVKDAHPFVIKHSDWTSQHNGGNGAVREACELIMQAQGKLDAALMAYLA